MSDMTCEKLSELISKMISEITILNHPTLLLLLGLSLILCQLDKCFQKTGGRLTLFSAFLTVGSCAYAILLGVGIGEILTVLLLFLCLSLEGWA